MRNCWARKKFPKKKSILYEINGPLSKSIWHKREVFFLLHKATIARKPLTSNNKSSPEAHTHTHKKNNFLKRITIEWLLLQFVRKLKRMRWKWFEEEEERTNSNCNHKTPIYQVATATYKLSTIYWYVLFIIFESCCYIVSCSL